MPDVRLGCIAELFESMNKLDEPGKSFFYRVLLGQLPMRVLWLLRQDHDLNVVLEVDQHHELLQVVDEDPAADRPVVVDPRGVMVRVPLEGLPQNPRRLQPRLLRLLELPRLHVPPVELAQHLDDLPLDLELGLLRHQRGEGHAPEVAARRELEVGHLLGQGVFELDPLRDPLVEGLHAELLLELVGVPEVVQGVELLDHRLEQVRIGLVGVLVRGQDPHGALGPADPASHAQLDVAALGRVLLLELRPQLAGEMPLQEGVVLALVKVRVGDDRHALGHRAVNRDSVLS